MENKDILLSQIPITELVDLIATKVVEKMNQSGQMPPNKDRLMAPEAAEHLGVVLSTLYAYVHKADENRIPFKKRGKALWFSRVELDKWMEEGNPGRKKDISRTELKKEFTKEFGSHITD